jgi:glycosyltransferase involved in cell wall biosynthesis
MKILFLTNFYPPCNYGWGYAQLCEEVANGLSDKGHRVFVLTSKSYGNGTLCKTQNYPIFRKLSLDPNWNNNQWAALQFFFCRRRREQEAIKTFYQIEAKIQPDLIFVWHAIGITRKILQIAENQLGTPVAYYLAGYLPEIPDDYIYYWELLPSNTVKRRFKRPIASIAIKMIRSETKPIKLKFENVICVSEYVRNRLLKQELIQSSSIVIHNGIDINFFRPKRTDRDFSTPLSLLYAGRLEKEKGVHLILIALSLLSKAQLSRIDSLTIVGNGDPKYIEYLANTCQRLGLTSLVRFEPPVGRSDMPDLLDKYDILIFPSNLEALSRIVQEAMAMELLVISTNTGGNSELLQNGKNALVIEPECPESLAEKLGRAVDMPDFAASLAKAGRCNIIEGFDIRRTIDRVEEYILQLVNK